MRAWAFALAIAFAPLAEAGVESAALVASPDAARLYSANLDAGSVSAIDARSGERLVERVLGSDVRRLALSADGETLLATDPAADRVYLLDAEALRLRRQVALPGRPFGTVYDAVSERFWVTLFEGAALVALDRSGAVVERVSCAGTPRGLALLSDGRLLVTHALLGAVSIYDTRQSPPAELGRIALHAAADPDPFVSQGLPRLLDDIAIHPDESEAWLPHVLWSFDHPFQFRSTVFPAVSVLSLERGAERELEDRRKQLFRQIDIADAANRTRIVSNPHDAAFSPDGSRVYVTAAASEDLLVFDLSRRAASDAPRRSRRRGKQSQGGAQAVQILRHLPGDNPRALAVLGESIYVQNAMSLDVARLDRGGEGPFARVAVAEAEFARPVGRDPLDPALRRGKRIFFSGNTDEFAEYPLAGDFWMSCGSCHLDGFDFTNRFLLRDAKRIESEPGGAVRGHAGLRTLVAADFVGDYIRMVQDTQGGMGADEREADLERVDPDAPPEPVARRMRDLHAYVTASRNLPYLSTWLRLEGGARSAPEPIDERAWENPGRCAECHPDAFEQWASSNHRLMASSNPYYQVLEDLAAESEGEALRAWCMGCHNPKHLTAGRTRSAGVSRHGERSGASLLRAAERGDAALDEGTDCLFCHRVTSVDHAGGNASLAVNLESRERYPFEDRASGPLRWFAERLIEARPEVHARSYLRESYGDSRYCGSCHSEFAPGSGAVTFDTYAEWEASPFNTPGDPERHRSCLDCHMHGDVRRIGEPVPGLATRGGSAQRDLRAHRFTGASHDLLALRDPVAAEQSRALLESAAELEVELAPAGLRVRVRNVGAGHHLPTGVADLRQLWLAVRVRDASGALLVESGELLPGGALSPTARIFNKVLGDARGQPVGLRFWRYETLLSDTRIPAGGFRDEFFELPQAPRFPLQADVELRFRTVPVHLWERARERVPELPRPAVLTLKRWSGLLRGIGAAQAPGSDGARGGARPTAKLLRRTHAR